MLLLFLKGSLIGFSVAMPVGPVGMLCMQQSLRRGLFAGIIAGLGAAAADAFYGIIACFSLSLIANVVNQYQLWFQIIGSLILWYIGIKTFKTTPKKISTLEAPFSYNRIFLSAFILTITNPLTLICFAAVYAGLGITPENQEFLPTAILTFGILGGSVIAWILLSFGVSTIGKKYQLACSPLLNQISGGFLTGCGCVTSFSALKQFLHFI